MRRIISRCIASGSTSPIGLAELQVVLAAGNPQFQELLPLADADFAHPAVAIDGAPGGLLQVVAVLHGLFLALDTGGRLHVQFDLGGNDAAFGTDGQQPHVGLVVPALDAGGGHFDLLHQLAFVGVHGVQTVEHVVFIGVGGGVAQRTQRVHRAKGLLAPALQAAIDALRFVHDQDRARGADQVDGLFSAGLLAVLVEIVDILLVDRADRHHHDLDVRAGGEVAHLAQLAGVVKEILERHVGVQAAEMLLGDLKRLVNAFLDRHRGDDDDELGKAVPPVQLEDGAQVNVGLAGAGLHLHGKIARGQRSRRTQAIAELDVAQVGQDFIVQQVQAVADAQIIFNPWET